MRPNHPPAESHGRSPARRTVQISLDVGTIDEALQIAEIAVRGGVDWLEAGTGLLFVNGIAPIRALRQHFPDHPIVADMKVADGGYYFGRMVAEAGATHLDILAAAHPATLEGAVRAAEEFGLTILGDLMLSPDPVAGARRLQELGVHYAMLHLGAEHRQRHPELTALDNLDAVRHAVTIPVQVVGGLSVAQAVEAARRGADSIVLGGPLVPGDRGADLEATLREVVAAVKSLPPNAGH
jgi:3-hexulose-6-phosphate synthase/6-phospho-3-hexuloisomerase